MPQTESLDAPEHRPTIAITPAGLRHKIAAAYVGVSTATWSRLVAGGLAPKPIKLNGCTLWPRAWLDDWLQKGCPSNADFQQAKAWR